MTGPFHSATRLEHPALRGLLCAALLAVSLAVPRGASARSLLVDDDGAQCPTAAFTTIQDAVAAAEAGNTIKVCPGSYGGQVVIDKTLKIKGKAPKYKDCNALPTLDSTLHSIFDAPAVTGLGGIGIDVVADKVMIQGLVVRNAGEVGIRTDAANVKFSLKKSIFTQNANGVYFHSAVGSKSAIKSNCFHQNGTGIRSGYGLRDASIAKNLFFGSNIGAGIILDQQSAATNDRVKVSGNRSEGDATFAVIVGTVDSVLSKNKVNAAGGTAIFVGGNNVNLGITGNTVTNPGTRGIRFNTFFFGGSASTGVVVTKNVVDKAGIDGIAIDSSAGESALVSSLMVKNTVTGSGQSGAGDGIRLEDPTASGANGNNTIQANTISASFNHDCHDETTGGGTAGTGNTWSGNTATTQNVADLCFTGAANGEHHVVCGDGFVSPGEQCDDGAGNSEAPDATCRTDCRLRRCGDGILDSGSGETCEAQSDCSVGETCFACTCVTGPILGELPFSVVPGPSDYAPVDDGQSSWLKVTSIAPAITNGSQGNFNPGPLLLEAGPVGVDGIAALIVKQTAYIGANAPSLGGGGKACFRIEQDPSNLGFVDCDGGSNVDASLSVDSHYASANDVPALTIGGLGDSGAGAAVIRVLITGSLSDDPDLACEDANYAGARFTTTAFTTGTARGTIFHPRQGGTSTTLALSGQPFNCANWTENSGGSIVAPNTNMDVTVGGLGTFDLVQTWRLNDD